MSKAFGMTLDQLWHFCTDPNLKESWGSIKTLLGNCKNSTRHYGYYTASWLAGMDSPPPVYKTGDFELWQSLLTAINSRRNLPESHDYYGIVAYDYIYPDNSFSRNEIQSVPYVHYYDQPKWDVIASDSFCNWSRVNLGSGGWYHYLYYDSSGDTTILAACERGKVTILGYPSQRFSEALK